MTRAAQRLSFAGLCLAVGLFARAETGVNQARGALEQWVQTHQAISRTRADWIRDKELLEQTVALYERELKTLAERRARVDTNTVAQSDQRTAVVAKQTRYLAALEAAAARFGAVEAKLQELRPAWPPSLRTVVEPLYSKLPADSASTNVSAVARMQAVITILNEVDKFHGAITVTEETRQRPDGKEVAVSVLYAGLGAAWFADDKGAFAGFGVPTPEGWQWTIRNEIGPEVAASIRMYRNEVPARFVGLPVQVH